MFLKKKLFDKVAIIITYFSLSDSDCMNHDIHTYVVLVLLMLECDMIVCMTDFITPTQIPNTHSYIFKLIANERRCFYFWMHLNGDDDKVIFAVAVFVYFCSYPPKIARLILIVGIIWSWNAFKGAKPCAARYHTSAPNSFSL